IPRAREVGARCGLELSPHALTRLDHVGPSAASLRRIRGLVSWLALSAVRRLQLMPRTRRAPTDPPSDAWGAEALRVPPEGRTHLERRGIVARPMPPESCDDERPETFVPAPEFEEWIRGTFIDASGPL